MATALELLPQESIRSDVEAFNRHYLHWEELRRHQPLPADPFKIWILMKVFRHSTMRSIPFADWRLGYNLGDACQRALHTLDKTAGGSLVGLMKSAGQDGDRYILNALMEEAIASSQIEGAATTRRVAKKMLRENRRPRTRDERMIVNTYLTMKMVTERKHQPLSIDLILEMHRMITAGTLEDSADEGNFRQNDEVRVVDQHGTVLHTPPSYTQISRLMDDVCTFVNSEFDHFLHPVVKGIILHFLIGFIHPFNDGNGRCARTLFYWFLLREDYWLFEYMPISRAIREKRGQYKRAFLYTESDGLDLTYFIRYNLDVIIDTLAEVRGYIERTQMEQHRALILIEGSDELNLRQVEILKRLMQSPERTIGMREVMGTFGVAYATARADLYRLEELGYLVRIKMGKTLQFLYNRQRVSEIDRSAADEDD
jgi:Fic family protein